MKFIDTRPDFPVSNAVVYGGYVFQTDLTGVPPGEARAVPGGAAAEMGEIFRQLDRILGEVGAAKTDIVSARLYLENIKRDLDAVNAVYAGYFGSHAPSRAVYGVELEPGILVQAHFLANVPVYE